MFCYFLLMKNKKQYINGRRLKSALNYINRNLQNNISVKALSREAFMSEPSFFRCFKLQFGITPVEYIIRQRIKVAKMMLRAADVPISEISYSSGFNNMSYFLRTFKRRTGLTPSQYRKSIFA